MNEVEQIEISTGDLERKQKNINSSRVKFIAIVGTIVTVSLLGLFSINTIRSENPEKNTTKTTQQDIDLQAAQQLDCDGFCGNVETTVCDNSHPSKMGTDQEFCEWLIENNLVSKYLDAHQVATEINNPTYAPLAKIFSDYGNTIGNDCYGYCGKAIDQTPTEQTTTITSKKINPPAEPILKETTTIKPITTIKPTTTIEPSTTEPAQSCEPNKYPAAAGKDYYFCNWLLEKGKINQYIEAIANGQERSIHQAYGATIELPCYGGCGPLPYSSPSGWDW